MRIHTTQTPRTQRIAITYSEKLRKAAEDRKREERQIIAGVIITLPVAWALLWLAGIATGA